MDIRDKRVTIIGAGAAGISLAYFLYRYGVTKICVFEKELIGSGSTGRCAGIVSTQLWNEIDVKLVRRSIEIFEEISNKVPFFKTYKSGLISMANTEKSRKYINKLYGILKQEKIAYKIYEGKDVEKNFPFLKVHPGTLVLQTPHDLYCDPGMFLYTIYSYLRKKNVEFRLLKRVDGFKSSGKELKGVWAKGIFYPADIFIICSGVWTGEILSELGIKLPLLPYRAQIGVLRKKDLQDIPVIHDLDRGIYLRVEFPDKVILGDGTETQASSLIFRETPDEKFIYEVVPSIVNIVKDFEDSEYMGGWAGLCGATPDRHPLIGKIPGFENLFIFTGFNGFGFMRIPSLAENFSLYLTGEKPEINIFPYFLDRFEGKVIEKFEIREGFSFID